MEKVPYMSVTGHKAHMHHCLSVHNTALPYKIFKITPQEAILALFVSQCNFIHFFQA